MILTKTIQIEITKWNNHKFSEKKIGDKLDIDISALSLGSNQIIKAKCEICGSEKDISYKIYNRRVKDSKSFACSKKCSAVRTKEILMEKYGVKNISQVPEVREKIKRTNLEKYGKENFFGSEPSKQIIKDSLLKKYGEDNPQKVIDIKNKTRENNLKKWGVEYTLQSKEIRDNIIKTNLEKWGFEQASKSEFVKSKMISTNQKKYGGNSPMSSLDIQEKSKQTLINNYGVSNAALTVSTNENFRKKYIMCNDPNYIIYLGDGISLFKCDKGKEHEFEISSDNYTHRRILNNPFCTICYPISDNKSIKEKELLFFIKSIYKEEVIESYRDGIEIDIYLPDLKIGFEFNGVYWHSESKRGKYYHIDKTNYFKSKGIRIIHIWEDDWNNRKEIIKSQIINLLNLNTNKIFARKCIVKEILDSKISSDFLNENHIQGKVASSIKIGLYHLGELVSIMTFDKFEGRNKMKLNEYNLSRFCNKINTNVVGGASKLLKFFIRKYNPERVISYADKDWSLGNLYYQLGFYKLYESKPDYKYIIDNKRINKSKFRKSKLKTNLSEKSHMIQRGIDKIYDCGKIKFEKKIEKKIDSNTIF